MKRICYFLLFALWIMMIACEPEERDHDSGDADCVTKDNTANIGLRRQDFAPAGIKYFAPYSRWDLHEYRVDLASPYRYLRIRLSAYQDVPTDSSVYDITWDSQSLSPLPWQAYLEIETLDGKVYSSDTGSDVLYVYNNHGAITFAFCDVAMYYESGYKFGISGRVVSEDIPEKQAVYDTYISNNSLFVDDAKVRFPSADVYYAVPGPNRDYYEFSVKLAAPYDYLSVRFSSAALLQSGTYKIEDVGATMPLDSGYASVYMVMRDGSIYSSNDDKDIGITVDSDSYAIAFDNIYMGSRVYYGDSKPYFHLWGRVLY